ncbi:hypothetical protein [Variovorax sp.]|uniref:hypothetical protein n=1 Tax=Variovorax sp. TaxID=1871043 RepID=UPI003BA88A46
MTSHTIHGLEIELRGSQAEGREVLLKQEFGGTIHQVELQDLHVCWLAEQLGIVAAMGAAGSTTPVGDPRELQRAVLRCSEMAIALLRSIEVTHGCGHEDLEPEIHRAKELSGFLTFLCTGFGPSNEPAAAQPAASQPSNSPGGLFAEGSEQ